VLIIARIDSKSFVLILIKMAPFLEKILIFSLSVINLVSGFRALVMASPIFEESSDEKFCKVI